jgi:hypothetical protein
VLRWLVVSLLALLVYLPGANTRFSKTSRCCKLVSGQLPSRQVEHLHTLWLKAGAVDLRKIGRS